ncbi:HAMP domain-containing histidine kinase [Alkalihalobacillus oceani]|uniref:histidine kinase n=1 Tax=Halalkalibacter oceani TaxID=1653776 RepID=A0A9X2IMF6_9BACI|nr:HAMP domain-containing sensor histidine kinase [Halalkalibacter oceani]MCM3713839.1 HAMP domain-containing histidine kinase [Halalkalibacter oceani]
MLRTIKAKFLLGFFLIFILSFLVLNHTVKETIWSNNQKIVTSDLVDLKKNSNVYVRQAFLINQYSISEFYFMDMADEMVNDLTHATGSEVSVYTVDGVLLSSSEETLFSGKRDDDLKQAIAGESAYHITYMQDQAEIRFSYPVIIDGTKVGILRFAKDFNLLYQQSSGILNFIFYIALLIFGVAFLFSYILSGHITKPIIKLTEASSEIKKGNLDVDIHFNRQDEIGRLAENFNDMINKIRDQISTIERDRDQLKELNEQEKRFFDNITHELKTPLTSIIGYGKMIKEKGDADHTFFNKGMNHIVEESQRLHDLVIKLLEVSRRTSFSHSFERVDAGETLKDVCESMAFRAERYKKNIDCAIENNLYMSGQPDRLRQLFINLIDNAIKYSSSFSSILVKAGIAEDSIHFRFENPSTPLETDQYSKLFQPFYAGTHKITEEGSVGLGLSIVKTIVDEHGGTITISNTDEHIVVNVEFAYKEENSS